MAEQTAALQAEFTRRVRAAIAAFGTEWSSRALCDEYQDRGVGRSTVFRWLRRAKDLGGQAGATDSSGVVGAAVEDIPGTLAPIPTMTDVSSKGLLPVVDLLNDAIRNAQDLIQHARTADGAVRNARLLMQASEHLRRAVETAARLNETIGIQQEMQRFHGVVMEEIGREAPALQQKILMRMRRACDVVLVDG